MAERCSRLSVRNRSAYLLTSTGRQEGERRRLRGGDRSVQRRAESGERRGRAVSRSSGGTAQCRPWRTPPERWRSRRPVRSPPNARGCTRRSPPLGGRCRLRAEDALDRLEDPAGLEGLDDEVLGAGLDRLDDERLLAHGAAHQDARGGIELRDL